MDVFDQDKLSEVSYEEGAMHVADGGLYLHYQGNKVLLHPSAELQAEETEVSEAEVLALNSSPVDIIPAQGENKVINPISVVVIREAGTAYTLVENLNFSINNNVIVSIEPTIVTSPSGIRKGAAQAGNLAANQPLKLRTATTDPVGGTGGIKVRVIYDIIDIS